MRPLISIRPSARCCRIPYHADRNAGSGGPHCRRDHARASRSRFSATTMSMVRRLRRCCAGICATAGSIRSSIFRIGCSRATARMSMRCGRLRERGAKLLVTVDCGTTSPDALAEAAMLGLDAVVIDHHQADEQLPQAIAVVNPNRVDDLSGLGHLAAVGLVFVTVVAVNRELRKRGYWTADRPEPDLLVAARSGRARHHCRRRPAERT